MKQRLVRIAKMATPGSVLLKAPLLIPRIAMMAYRVSMRGKYVVGLTGFVANSIKLRATTLMPTEHDRTQLSGWDRVCQGLRAIRCLTPEAVLVMPRTSGT